MTREKAKKILRSWDGVYIGYSSDEVEEAHNMAIQALSQEQISLNDINNALGASFRNGVRSVKVEQQSCDDAISREELLKAIDTWDKFGYTETGCFVRAPKGDYVPYIHYDDVIKCIKGMPSVTQKSGKWIKRTDRLPEDKTYVLTTIKVPNRVAHARSGWYEGGFFHNDNGDTWRATDMEVKAWMPLPEPYEPQESEGKE